MQLLAKQKYPAEQKHLLQFSHKYQSSPKEEVSDIKGVQAN